MKELNLDDMKIFLNTVRDIGTYRRHIISVILELDISDEVIVAMLWLDGSAEIVAGDVFVCKESK